MKQELTQKEQEYFVKIISKAKDRLPYPIADPSGVKIYWNEKYDANNGILGSFDWKKPSEINLIHYGKDAPEMLVSVVAHELHHKWQFGKYGVLYFIMAIPLLREFLLEKTADKVEKAMDELMEDEEFIKEIQ